jgi:hypothetical protein
MNPNLDHGEMIRGVNAGRGAGIMGGASLIRVSQAVALLEAEGGLDSEISAGLRQWYASYLKWRTTSKNGRSEKATKNNHATWCTAQAASHATFVHDEAARRMAWDRFRDYLVPTEIQPDGSCPREEERTRSLHYSSMNLDAFSLLCRLAQTEGLDLWRYRNARGYRRREELSLPGAVPASSGNVEREADHEIQHQWLLLPGAGRDRPGFAEPAFHRQRQSVTAPTSATPALLKFDFYAFIIFCVVIDCVRVRLGRAFGTARAGVFAAGLERQAV